LASSSERSHHFKTYSWRTSSPLHPNLGFRYTHHTPSFPIGAHDGLADAVVGDIGAVQFSTRLLANSSLNASKSNYYTKKQFYV
jgi:hypothetical protein